MPSVNIKDDIYCILIFFFLFFVCLLHEKPGVRDPHRGSIFLPLSPQSSCLVELLSGRLFLCLRLFHTRSVASWHWVLLCVLLQFLLDHQVHAVFVHVACQRVTLIGFTLSSQFLSQRSQPSKQHSRRWPKKAKTKQNKKRKSRAKQLHAQVAKTICDHTPRGAHLLVAA